MSDTFSDGGDNFENNGRVSRPTLPQLRAIVSFMEKNPDLAHRKLRVGMGHAKFKKLWIELSNTANSIHGAFKSTEGWIKFWSDKRRSIVIKQKQIALGKIQGRITPLEQKILDLCDDKSCTRKKKAVKEEPCNGDDDDLFTTFSRDGDGDISQMDNNRLHPTESEERQLNMIEKLVGVMDQQSAALTQMAQASLSNSKALERIAEASHIQALAVDRLAGTFETISASVHDVRNAILGIDYTMKRYYPPTATQQRQNSNIFS